MYTTTFEGSLDWGEDMKRDSSRIFSLIMFGKEQWSDTESHFLLMVSILLRALETGHVRSVESGSLATKPFNGHTGGVYSVSCSPNGRRIDSGSADKTARSWDASNGDPLSTFLVHPDHVYSITHSNDGLYAVSGYKDRLAFSSFNPVFHQKSIVSHPSLRLTISISNLLQILKMEQFIFCQ